MHSTPTNFLSDFYIQICIKKLTFFLDPNRRLKIPIRVLATSHIFTELQDMHDEKLTDQHLRGNWFSVFSAHRIYTQYLVLGGHRTGMLTRDDLLKYRNASFTPLFIQRVFETTQTYNGEMDFMGYIEFVLSMENPTLPASIKYCFRAFDVNGEGWINEYVIELFVNVICLFDAGGC